MSRSIPPSIKVEGPGVVVGGGADVPLMAVYEFAKGSADEFLHPGPNNDREHWYWQFRVKPFAKARAHLRAQTTAEANVLIDRVARARDFPAEPL